MGANARLFARGLLALCAMAPLLSACDGARDKVAAAIRPATAVEEAGALRELIAQGKFKEASARGASFLESKEDQGGVLAWETAKACAQAGRPDDAIRFAGLAVKGGATPGVNLMSEPLLEPLRTDPRLVALAAGGVPIDAPLDLSATVAAPAAAEAVEASVDGGVKARAGDVSVSLPQ